MRSRIRRLPLFLLVLNAGAQPKTPPGFHWVNFKREPNTAAQIAHALQAEDYTAIREIGVVADSALVFTTTRDPTSTTPEGDAWSVYNVSTIAAKSRKLITGYDLHIVAWLKLLPGDNGELGITYLDCSECEPATLFTTLHYLPKDGWRVRWPAKDPRGIPGVVFNVSDAGAPYTDEDVDQVWAVVTSPSGVSSIGTWYHSRDLKTGKITSIATKFLVTSPAGDEKSLTLKGPAAASWERTLCQPSDFVFGLIGGQDSKSCKHLLQQKASTGGIP